MNIEKKTHTHIAKGKYINQRDILKREIGAQE